MNKNNIRAFVAFKQKKKTVLTSFISLIILLSGFNTTFGQKTKKIKVSELKDKIEAAWIGARKQVR
jgi:hypothetical protein